MLPTSETQSSFSYSPNECGPTQFKMKHILPAFLLLGFCSSASAQSSPPSGYTWTENPFNGHYYALTDAKLWADAQSEAVSVGCNLVTIRSSAEQDWLFNTLVTQVVEAAVHIGINDISVEGAWEWVSGEPVTFTKWYSGEPNNAYGGEDEGMMWSNNTGLTPSEWNDGNASQFPGVIEWYDDTTVYVDQNGNGDYSNIQSAIDGSGNGDTVIVRDGTYVENIDFNGKAITVKSENGPATTIIDGNQAGAVVTFYSGEGPGSILQGLTITNGEDGHGGGIRIGPNPSNSNGNPCSPIIRHCIVENNVGTFNGTGGIGINHNSQALIENCLIQNNTSDVYGAAIIVADASPIISQCTIRNNTSTVTSAIMMWNDSTVEISNCIFGGNTMPNVGRNNTLAQAMVGYTLAQGSTSEWWWLNSTSCIDDDPMLVDLGNGDNGDAYLSHIASGQVGDSPCIDAGNPLTIPFGITRTDRVPDTAVIDMGYHNIYIYMDSDSDGLSDVDESAFGTNPHDQDTDDDGLSDGEEVNSFSTDPLNTDSDSDGMQDGTEVGNDTWWLGEPWNGIDGTDTSINIPDVDPSTTTDPLDDDTDNDGLMDGQEDVNQDGEFMGIELDPNDFDGDNDGLGDGLELGLTVPNGNDTDMTVFVADSDPSTTTRATFRDTDGGGIHDGLEDANRNGMIDAGEIDPRDASDDSVYLKHNGASVGGHTTLNFYACEPGSWMFLCYSLAGAGPTAFTNVTLDLTQPIGTFSSIRIDSNGSGQVGPLPVPASVSVGDQAWFQGVQVSIFGTSTVLTTTNMTPLTIQ
jgi:hypothetical protein